LAKRRRVCFLLALALFLTLEGRENLLAQSRQRGNPEGSLAAYAAGIFSSEPSSTEGALTLLLPTGAKGVGMGRAVTASPGPESVFWNPAGLARLDRGHFQVFRGNHLAGEATAVSLILTRQPIGAIGVSYQLLDLGDQDFTDNQGNVLGTVSFRDHLAIVSAATQALPRMDVGVNFKVFQTRVTCRGDCPDAGVTGRTFAIDAGLMAVPFDSIPLRLGVMVAHAGPNLQLINVEQADPLPTRLRVAASLEVLSRYIDVPGIELWAIAELEDRWRDLGSPVLYLGGELLAGEGDQFFIRAGYGQGQSGQPAGAAVGLGIHYDRFNLGIAKSLSGTTLGGESEPVHITFGVLF
jgi:hypothetical protein